MKYSFKRLLMFFEHQVSEDFATIKNIVTRINDENYLNDATVEEIRDYILQTLRNAGMVEEGYSVEQPNSYTTDKPEIIMQCKPAIAVMEEFEFQMHDRIYHMLIYLN